MKTLIVLAAVAALVSTPALADGAPRAPVSTVGQTTLVVGQDTCMGSTSMGAAGVNLGVSFSTTWVDKNCQRLKNARELADLGFKDAAIRLMCQDKDVTKAMADAGTACTEQRQVETPPAAVPAKAQ